MSTNYQYTYEVVEKDTTTNTLVLSYAAIGKQPILVSTRMPFVGETIDQVAAFFAPTGVWQMQDAQYDTSVQVGQAGVSGAAQITPPVTTLDGAKMLKKLEIAQWRYTAECAGVAVNGAIIKTDPESQAKITGAMSALSNGLAATINWKTEQGNFVTLDLAAVTAVAQAVFDHVQGVFNTEMALVAQVNAATDINTVLAITTPAI